MIHSLSSRIADFFVVQNVAKEEEKEEYVYGIDSASFFAAYQPKEPDSLKKKDK